MRSEVLTAVKVQDKVFWVVMPCSVMAARFSKMLVSYHKITWCQNPENNLNYYTMLCWNLTD
jgi:hypothetical protein